MVLNRLCNLLVLGWVSALVFGCATPQEFTNLKNDVNQLKKTYYALDKDVAVLKKDVDVASAKGEEVVSQESFNALRDTQEQLGGEMQSLARDVQLLQGRLDEGKFFGEKTMKDASLEFDIIRSRLNKMEQEIAALRKKVEDLEAGKPAEGETAQASPGMEPEAGGKTAGGPAGDDPKNLYASSYESLKNEQYADAKAGFSEFMKKYPTHELADNAQFWLGETYYKEKDYENAILTYEKLLKDFPKSPKVPAAMLKQARSFEAIGDEKTAKVIYQLLIQKYPGSPEAKSAVGKVPQSKQ